MELTALPTLARVTNRSDPKDTVDVGLSSPPFGPGGASAGLGKEKYQPAPY